MGRVKNVWCGDGETTSTLLKEINYKRTMENKQNYIQRLYRVSVEQDKLVKKNAKKLKVSESGYIRLLIEGGYK